jgi:SAM-dependent methyltransferase
MIKPSKFDNDTFALTREHLNSFINKVAKTYGESNKKLLEIGSQDRSEVKSAFNMCNIETLDLVPDYNPDIIGDITKYNPHIKDSSYDIVACLEILEHTINPFSAIEELRRITKDGGYILFSAPLNWRIHGPVPDCWRFTEFGWRVLLKDFDIIKIDKLETPDRNLFPIKYNILAKCDKSKNVDVYSMKFEPIK